MDSLRNEHLKSQIEGYLQHRELNFWDFGKIASKSIKPSDKVYILCKNNLYTGFVIDIIEDESGKLGDALQWKKQYEKPWVNVVLIGKLSVYKNLSNELVNKILYFKDTNGNKVTKNFFSFRDDETISQFLKRSPYQTPEVNQSHIQLETKSILRKKATKTVHIPHELNNIINNIKELHSNNFSERDNESLVEKFFTFLGFKSPREIRFQSGRVDIGIFKDDEPLMVIEVKKDLNLSYKNGSVVKQAYKYSLENGSRFVIITNGDYYGVFDRDRGRSIKSNFVADFKLTELNDDDAKTIELLKPPIPPQ